LERAAQLLASQPEDSTHAVLLISDGDFVEMGLNDRISRLASDGIRTHVLGIGTSEGGLVMDPNGRPLYDRSGKQVRSRLNESLLRSLADAGQGEYQLATFRDTDTKRILSEALQQTSVQIVRDARTRVWNERFYWLVGLTMLLLLPRFRRIRLRIRSKQERQRQW
jgi:Ca-activated chloride channel family protein